MTVARRRRGGRVRLRVSNTSVLRQHGAAHGPRGGRHVTRHRRRISAGRRVTRRIRRRRQQTSFDHRRCKTDTSFNSTSLVADAGGRGEETDRHTDSRHFGTIAQLCRAVSSQLRHVLTIGKKVLIIW